MDDLPLELVFNCKEENIMRCSGDFQTELELFSSNQSCQIKK